MSDTPQNAERARLEEELRQAQAAGDHLDALDVYDALKAQGWMSAEHWIGLGHSLLSLRRKQDARQAWLRAHEVAPQRDDVIKLLDEYFPGWKKATAPPPRPPVVSTPAVDPTLAPRPAATRPTPTTPPAPSPAAGLREADINWSFVLEDVALILRETPLAARRSGSSVIGTTADSPA